MQRGKRIKYTIQTNLINRNISRKDRNNKIKPQHTCVNEVPYQENGESLDKISKQMNNVQRLKINL